jgi:hypothetical protein
MALLFYLFQVQIFNRFHPLGQRVVGELLSPAPRELLPEVVKIKV